MKRKTQERGKNDLSGDPVIYLAVYLHFNNLFLRSHHNYFRASNTLREMREYMYCAKMSYVYSIQGHKFLLEIRIFNVSWV